MDAKMSGQTTSATTTASTITTQEVISWRLLPSTWCQQKAIGVLGRGRGEFGEFSHGGFLAERGAPEAGVGSGSPRVVDRSYG